MKKLYTKTWHWCRGFKKAGISALVLFGAAQTFNAQVNLYTFSQSSGSFNSIASTGTLVTGSDATTTNTNDTAGWTIAIPFTYNFNNTNYTSLYANSNGGVTFGATTYSSSSLISTSTAYSGSISVMDRDLWGVFYSSGVTTSGSNVITGVTSFLGMEVGKFLNSANGIPTGATVTAFDAGAGTITMSANATSSSATAAIRYGTGKILTSVEGTAPNRVFVVEWIGYNDYSSSTTAQSFLNFQLRLEETTNKVNIVYGSQFNNSTGSKTNQIGLRGATNADYNNRLGAVANPWTATAAGTSNSSSVSRDNTNFPAAGLTFTWSPPTCLPPSTSVYSGTTSSSTNISWNASSSAPANGYQLYYSTTNVAPTSATVLNSTNSVSSATNMVSITGLNTATNYFVWGRAVCSSSDSSIWSSFNNFTTLCTAFATPYSQNFDTTATGTSTVNNAPTCWTYLETAGSAAYGYVSTSNNQSAPNSYYLYNSSDNAGNVMLVSPQTTNLSDGTKRVKFSARATAGYILEIGTVSNVADPASYTALSSGATITLTAAYAQYIVNIPAGGSNNLAFRHGLGGTYRGIYLDDITVEAIPSCIAPTAASITGATASSLSVAWTAASPAPALGYQVYYSTTNAAPTGATVLTASNSVSSATTTATISGLPADVVQYVWVRSNCTTGDQSAWVSAGSANTGYCLPSASGTTYWISNFSSTSAATNIAHTGTATGAGGYKNLTATSKIANFAGSVTPINISLGSGTTPTAGFAVWIDWNNNLSFEASEKVYGTTSYINSTSGATITVPAAQALGNYRMRVAANYNSSTVVDPCAAITNGEYLDAIFEVVTPPTCTAPSAVVASAITTTTATVSWTAPATAPGIGYDVYYSTTNTAPMASTTPTTTAAATTVNLSGLTQSTVYYVWVRSSCSSADQSTWTGMPSFTTVTPAPINDNCAGAIAVTPGAIVSQNPVTSSTVNATTDSAPTCGFSANRNVWFSIVVPASGNVTIETTSATGSTLTDTILNVYTGICGALTSIGCNDDISAGSNNFSKVVLTNQAPGSTILASVWAYSTGDGAFRISAYDGSLATGESFVKENGVNIYPNPFSDFIRISDVKDVVSVSIVDMAGRIVKTVKPANEINLSSLKSGMYLINLTMKDGSVKTVKSIKK
ncbi:fibronectin type III domain-containing protein [Frigoriflavimonas asaccharolytica]|uniref:Fibronectin type-III domain-containing protein n=1 Tax=Frigoriflavimonas asaccharolytica TaxID=2735899 RepID=A0A8J8G976_9FLAO|nr:fibronectin type III domain-containing protein [Frigoriflavimonas asaccharolytica]NRS93005.1 hypothetical protein [Frigoriflavimonas asaccharolytica]